MRGECILELSKVKVLMRLYTLLPAIGRELFPGCVSSSTLWTCYAQAEQSSLASEEAFKQRDSDPGSGKSSSGKGQEIWVDTRCICSIHSTCESPFLISVDLRNTH